MSKGNEPAYPNELAAPTNDGYLSTAGLTKREYFAGLAMQGILSCRPDPVSDASWNEAVAAWSVIAADSLLAELEKTA